MYTTRYQRRSAGRCCSIKHGEVFDKRAIELGHIGVFGSRDNLDLGSAAFGTVPCITKNASTLPTRKKCAVSCSPQACWHRCRSCCPARRSRSDDAGYVLATFPIVKRKDIARHGEYRTKRVILEMYDAMAQAMAGGPPYQTRLNPPPADPRAAHPAQFPTPLKRGVPLRLFYGLECAPTVDVRKLPFSLT